MLKTETNFLRLNVWLKEGAFWVLSYWTMSLLKYTQWWTTRIVENGTLAGSTTILPNRHVEYGLGFMEEMENLTASVPDIPLTTKSRNCIFNEKLKICLLLLVTRPEIIRCIPLMQKLDWNHLRTCVDFTRTKYMNSRIERDFLSRLVSVSLITFWMPRQQLVLQTIWATVIIGCVD